MGDLVSVPGDPTDSMDKYVETQYVELKGYADDSDVTILTQLMGLFAKKFS